MYDNGNAVYIKQKRKRKDIVIYAMLALAVSA